MARRTGGKHEARTRLKLLNNEQRMGADDYTSTRPNRRRLPIFRFTRREPATGRRWLLLIPIFSNLSAGRPPPSHTSGDCFFFFTTTILREMALSSSIIIVPTPGYDTRDRVGNFQPFL